MYNFFFKKKNTYTCTLTNYVYCSLHKIASRSNKIKNF